MLLILIIVSPDWIPAFLATEEVAFDEVAVLYSRSEGKLIRRVAGDTYSINYGNSSLAKAGASGDGQFTAEEAEVGKTIVFTQKINDAQNRDGYVGVDLSKKSSIAATADVKVTFDFYTVANSACSADCGVVAVVDADGKVLASKTGLKLKTGAGSSEKETIEVGRGYLSILGYSQMFMCLEITMVGAFSGLGRTYLPNAIVIIFTALRIPMALLFSSQLGISGVWWSISLSSIVKGIILVALFFILSKSGGLIVQGRVERTE